MDAEEAAVGVLSVNNITIRAVNGVVVATGTSR